MIKDEKSNDPLLVPKAVFGIRSDIPKNIQFFSHDKCAYVAGNYIVICTMKEKTQFFVPFIPEFGDLTSFGLDEHRESIYLAFAQKTSDFKSSLCITRYQHKKDSNFSTGQILEPGKVFKFPGIALDPYESAIAISVNALKGIVMVLTGPKTPSKIMIYQHDLKTNNFKFSFSFEMTSPVSYKALEFNPMDSSFFLLWGDGGFAVYAIKDYDKKQITAKLEVDSRTPSYAEFSSLLFSFIGGVWISQHRFACVNIFSDVFILDIAKRIDTPLKKAIKAGHLWDSEVRVKAVYAKHRNLFVCRDDGALLKLEDKSLSDKVIMYEKVNNSAKMWSALPRMEVHTLGIYKGDLNNYSSYASSLVSLNSLNSVNSVLISTMDNQLFLVDISNELALTDGNNFRSFICPFHSDEITAIDVCKLKSLLVTASRDKTIRIWNYINLQNEITVENEEVPVSVAIHPNGLHLASLFKETCKLMHILEKALIVYRTFTVFHPVSVKFSNFGTYFNILSEKNFQIHNFFTGEQILSSVSTVHSHWDELTYLTWDKDDTGFATCGADGRVYYWTLNSNAMGLTPTQPNQNKNEMNQSGLDLPKASNGGNVFYSHHKEFVFNAVDIHTEEDGSKRLLLAEDTGLVCVSNINVSGSNTNNLLNSKEDNSLYDMKRLEVKAISNSKITDMFYDQDARIAIVSTGKDAAQSLHIIVQPFETRRVFSFHANSFGVNAMRATDDLNHVFTGGKDKCLFFFSLSKVSKTDRRDDNLESADLILIKKEDLDVESKILRGRLTQADAQIKQERDSFEEESAKLEKEISEEKANIKEEIEKYMKSKIYLENKFSSEIAFYEGEFNLMSETYQTKVEDLQVEWEKNVTSKKVDKNKEEDNRINEFNKLSINFESLRKSQEEFVINLKQTFEKVITDLNVEIKTLEEENKVISVLLEKDKSDKMESNDTQISIKRLELETLKKSYEKVKIDHGRLEEKLKNEIKEIKDNIRNAETKKKGNRDDLERIQHDNARLLKQISDIQVDRKEKEETIGEKNSIKSELEKENQELEKFKFVLNYKIKELKHDKDPEERKLQLLEKQAKDMEGEIKKFEFEQARNIIELSKNHDTMKVKEKQIGETENIIEKLKNYKKLFQESLYFARKKAKNHKDLKKELVKLKRLFLDKEFIDVIQKPYSSNYDSQRQFYEDNITNYGKKISDTQNLFTQDYHKIMRENKKLLTIVNELKKEIKEIKKDPEEIPMSKTTRVIRPNFSIKANVPNFGNENDTSNDQKLAKLKKDLFELDKELNLIKEKKKKLIFRERSKNNKKNINV